MRVFVAGGSGVVGRRLVAQLVDRGHEVTATTTDPGKFGLMKKLGANPVVMDGLDATSVCESVAEARPDVIVHEMTAIAGASDMKHMDRWFATTDRLRTEGTDYLLAAARESGVPHFVAQSYAGWNGIRRGGWVKTEDDPIDSYDGTSAQPVMAAIAHLERVVLEAGGAILRYGWLYGPGASDSLVAAVRKRQFPLVGDGRGHCSWLHVDDAANAAVVAVEKQVKGLFNIVDDEPAAANQWLPYLAACVGAKPPLRIPAWLARVLAGKVVVALMTEGRGFSNAKAKWELGWRPTYSSWRVGFREGLTSASADDGLVTTAR